MKTTTDYGDFEKLLQRKSFSELTDDERTLVCEFADEDEYASMRRLMTEVFSEMQSNMQLQSAPKGGSDEVWTKFNANKPFSTKKQGPLFAILNKAVPAWVPIGMAAAMIVAVFIIRPQVGISMLGKAIELSSIKPMQKSKTDTIYIETPIHYANTQYASVAKTPESDQSPQYSSNVYVPSLESVQHISENKAGTNVREMGALAQLVFSVD